jgi:hypothetical protein
MAMCWKTRKRMMAITPLRWWEHVAWSRPPGKGHAAPAIDLKVYVILTSTYNMLFSLNK